MKLKSLSIIISGVLIFSACNKQFDNLKPSNVVFEGSLLSTKDGIIQAVNGIYTSMVNAPTLNNSQYDYYYNYLNISEFRGNNVVYAAEPAGTSKDREEDAYYYVNSSQAGQTMSFMIWRTSYSTIVGINKILKAIPEDTKDAELKHIQGEMHFMRAMLNFNLVNIFGRPYYQGAEANPGIMLKKTDDQKEVPGRSTVKECYEFILSDLQLSLSELNLAASNNYVTKPAVLALLSRVYLYMGGTPEHADVEANKAVVKYTTDLINTPAVSLVTDPVKFASFYIGDKTIANPEVIFAFDYRFNGSSIFQFFIKDRPASQRGEVKVSPDYIALLEPTDRRRNFVSAKGEVLKYVGDNVNYDNAPFICFRLAETYLNRAEANAKLGNDAAALADLNVIRTRAGLQEVELNGPALMNEILVQRRIELAFEGHAAFDYFRNGRDMIRNYSSANKVKDIRKVSATDPKVVMRITEDELSSNPLLKQNVQ
ncbi:RagB/SusD family nutrient uptake outer membrane protein [Chitinophaga silvatica]|uniref:RagB/SusD family nutrient uptake outer membrane protein n=1 Tax=Chitinophaga silvatica TaxID=2282649 RepID=A0A3E1Y5J3_9BACT|nr:RagB/SusD family nutrient uptake outer membrane protein [Chitinophaga silvatica]RFS19995.1 RagB/SusD family nutrient uptake outer membrane protein [Chitinophaga silvatica]